MPSNKIKLLYILDILKESDENNPITTNKTNIKYIDYNLVKTVMVVLYLF